MNCLIVYYTRTENNEKLTHILKKRLNCHIHKIREVRSRRTISILFDFINQGEANLYDSNINLDEYDQIVFVSPIWGGKVATPLRTFICQEKAHICNYSFVSICNGEKGQKEKVTKELYTITQRIPVICLELSINKLLPKEKQNKIMHTFNYRLRDEELGQYCNEIEEFIHTLEVYDHVAQ